MAEQINAAEEDLIVPKHGTGTTSDKALVIGCSGTYGKSADVSISLTSGKRVFDQIAPGGSLRLDSTEWSYRVLLLSVGHESVSVRVFKVSIERSQENEAPPLVRVLETTKSCFAELTRIIESAFAGEKVKVRTDVDGFRICGRGLFGEELLSISGDNCQIFYNARWTDLNIKVLAARYLDQAKKIAEAYTLRTGSRATIYKEF
jgi:hypothetical protein